MNYISKENFDKKIEDEFFHYIYLFLFTDYCNDYIRNDYKHYESKNYNNFVVSYRRYDGQNKSSLFLKGEFVLDKNSDTDFILME